MTKNLSKEVLKGLSPEDKLDIIIHALAEISEEVDGLGDFRDEVLEKLGNISTPGVDFGYDN